MERADEEVPDHIPIHGYMFQLKLLVLFMCRGLTGGYSFNLGTEIKEAGKFDDLVFEFTLDRKKYFRLLQAKHKLDKTGSSITTNSLLNKIKSEFYLPKYFFSYLDAKNNSMFRGGTIKDVIICTNVNFNDKVLNNEDIKIQLLSNKDDLLDINMSCLTKPMRYKFTEEIVPKLNKILNDYKTKSKKVLSDYNDDDIKDFINHLVFAVDCPSEQELDEVIKREIEKQFNFLSNIFSVQNTYCRFMMTMLDWLQGKVRGRFISGEEGKQFFEEARKSIPVLFNIRGPVESFTGRNKELENLHKLLKISSDKTKVVCVTGIGGIGKTELARMYISNFAMEYNNNVLWFNAGSYQALEACFRSLASDKLSISTKNANGKDRGLISIVEDVYKTISNRKCLIIFDNVQHYQCKNECDDGIDRFLPSFSEVSGPYILITSRNQNWPSTIHVLSLDTFEKDEAVQFISKALKTDSNESSILADQMQCFPLALQQAVSYIKVQNMKLQNVGSHFNIACYLNLLKDKSKLVLNYSFPDESYIDYTQTVYITWNVTLDLIRKSENGNEALKIMNILSYMDPEDIPIEIFLKLVNDYDILSSALGILKQYSMITIHHKIISSEQQVGMINVHVLVQEVIRLKLVEDKEDRLILEEALQIFTKWENLNDRTLNHAMSVWDYSSKDGVLSEDKRYYCAWVSKEISDQLLVRCRYTELQSFGEKAIKYCSSLPMDEVKHLLETLKSNNDIALQILGLFMNAQRSFQGAISFSENKYGINNPLSLMIKKITHAADLVVTGEDDEALDILKSLSQPDGSDSKEFLGNLFLSEVEKYKDTQHLHKTYHKSTENKNVSDGHLDFAQKGFSEALDGLKGRLEGLKIFGNQPETLRAQSNLAEIFRKQTKLDEASKLFEETYEKQKTVLGKDHLDTLETLFGKGKTLEDQENFNDSLRIYQEVLENRITKLGKDHPSSLEACTSIGNIFYKLKDYDKALERYNEVLSISKKTENEADNLDIIIKIGKIYFNKGEINRALVVFEDAITTIEDTVGCDHSDYLSIRKLIAEIYQKQGKYDLALENLENILEFQKERLGENHPDCLFSEYYIAKIVSMKRIYKTVM
ncbi:uncharacterized protein [Halyomorpha halys]|uniref:uncharacterized protein n=1 Tax=Halyomorpha halys TaxID=286706 RepID=UPI0006D4D324|nr:uncharacterized protein LOC106679496 [Halyomorpha halys]XP_014274178.1 uncharacterized protein LOC106679496 [Halyomorpha halys]XP_014274179.1 uncharacterized protein LOC106679496 [Halyomorpha halys]